MRRNSGPAVELAHMPRFYFFVKDSDGHLIEGDDYELPDVEHARTEALQAIRDIVSDAVKHGHDSPVQEVVVTDLEGHPVLSLPATEAIPKRLRES